MRSGTWWAATLSSFGAMWALGVGLTWMASYAVDVRGFSSATAGLVVGLPSLLLIVASLAVGTSAQRLLAHGVRQRVVHGVISAIVLALGGVSLLSIAHIGPTWLALVAVAIAFSAGSVQTPLGNAAIASICRPSARSAALSISYGIAAIASILAPWLSGVLLDAAGRPAQGYATVFGLAGIILLIGALAAALFLRPERDRARWQPGGVLGGTPNGVTAGEMTAPGA